MCMNCDGYQGLVFSIP